MPIRAYCTICSDFFDNERDVAAVQCGHTFHRDCLIQWFDTAPSRTCPQCRIQVSKRHIINKLFFDVAPEEQAAPDAETLQKEKRECQTVVDGLRDTLDVRNATIESLQKVLGETEMLCSSLKKQMKFLEQQQEDNRSSKEEARRLRNKLRTMERIELLLQSQRPEVEEMIREMGVGQAAVEQLAIYCVSLKKEYENLKEARKISGEMTEKLKKELFSVNNKHTARGLLSGGRVFGDSAGAACAEPARVWQGACAGSSTQVPHCSHWLLEVAISSSGHTAEHSAASLSCCRTGPLRKVGKGL
uniref:TRAF interacting protein n=1 Tax=Malurus cyaneus samueli TaxID=2593467 RepID=A0A8C5UFS7_9PASS